MKNLLHFFGMVIISLAILLQVVSEASADSFNPNSIIDDALFNSSNSMGAAQIDSFLNSFPHSCISPNSGFRALDPTGYSPAGGFQYGGYVTAGQVIYDSAQAYGLNPQVLLVTLQKEQSLVVGGASYCNDGDEHKYAAAVGYGCPDGGTRYYYNNVNLYQRNGVLRTVVGPTCVNGVAKAGFSQQVIRGAWLLKFGQQRSLGNTGWAVIRGSWNNSDDPPTCYGGPMTQGNLSRGCGQTATYFDGYTTIDGVSTKMGTGATAALYWYTPHFSGNRHFFDIFTSWFGTVRSSPFFRLGNNPQIYIVGANNTYYYVPNDLTLSFYGLGSRFHSINAFDTSYTSGLTFAGNLPLVSQFEGAAPIYLVDAGGTLHHFPNEASFNNYGYSIGNQANLPGWIMNNYTVADTMQPVAKQHGNPAIYYVQNGKKSHISNWTAYTTMGSPTYYNQPSVTLSVSYANTLVSGAPILPPNMLVRSTDTNTYGYWDGGNLQPITSTIISDAGFNPDYSSTSGAINQLPTSGATLGKLGKNSAGTYYVLDGSTKLLTTTGQLANLGKTSSDFVATNDVFLNRFSSGTMQNLLRVKNTNPVKLIQSAELYHIFDPLDFMALGYSWNQINVVSPSTASLFTESGKTLFHDSKLVRIGNQLAVYLINGSFSKLWVPSESIFYNYGYSMQNVVSVPANTLDAYPTSANLAQVMKDTSGVVWLFDGGKKRKISTTLLSASYYNINQSTTLLLSNANVNAVPTDTDLTNLIQAIGNPKVYKVESGQKRWFTSESSFNANGGVWSNISRLAPSFVNSIPSGPDIN